RLGCSASSCLPCMYLDSFPTRRSSDLRKILYRILEKFKSLLRRHQTVGRALVRQGRQPVGDQIDIVRWRRHLSGGLEHIGEVGALGWNEALHSVQGTAQLIAIRDFQPAA